MPSVRRHLPALLLCALAIGGCLVHKAAEPANGLRVTIFPDRNFDVPAGPSFVYRQVHFHSRDDWHPAPKFLRNDMGLRLEGWVEVVRPGRYRFDVSSDDGSKLWVNDVLLIDNGGEHAEQGAS